MNRRVYKEYIKEIKIIFPVKGKQERKYIKNLSNDVADFCENENIESKEELYDSFSKYIKTILIAILTLAFISTLTYCIFLYQDHQITKRQETVISEDVIE